jgi:hypothetical protein
MTHQRKIYQSSNGDSWWLCRDQDGQFLFCMKRTLRLADVQPAWGSGSFSEPAMQGPSTNRCSGSSVNSLN